jgi:hypothetical protein
VWATGRRVAVQASWGRGLPCLLVLAPQLDRQQDALVTRAAVITCSNTHTSSKQAQSDRQVKQ